MSAAADDQKTWTDASDSPCANERYLAHFGLQVDPWNLDQCIECELCGSCQTHICYSDEASSVLHMDWFRDFASPGEDECGHIGGPSNLVPSTYQPRECNRVCGHDGKHRARMGWSWPQTPPTEGERHCGYAKRHPSHTFMRLEVLFQCPGEHGTEGER
jgi:hypothetical protein